MLNVVNQQALVDTGTWTWGDESVQWELYRSSTLPNKKDCTAVFCVAIRGDDKIVLAREDRGWGMIGGHVEDSETLEQALARECLEEGGFAVINPRLFGYRKIIATKPVTHQDPGRSYPFPISYIAYYYDENDQELAKPTEPEVLESGAFTIEEIEALRISDYGTIRLGWECYRGSAA